MKVAVAVIGFGGWYPRGVARLIQSMHQNSHDIPVIGWVNCLPPESPLDVVESGYDYTAYCAKPFALKDLSDMYDVGILVDAAFYAVGHLGPLVSHIKAHGYYLCNNGNFVGNWSSDRALEEFELDREAAMGMREASSYCVGIDFSDPKARLLVEDWCDYARDGRSFPGPHTNTGAGSIAQAALHAGQRNPGFCSADPRVYGHRHDQTALSILAHRHRMTDFVDRPRFTAYKSQGCSAETLLVNEGGL